MRDQKWVYAGKADTQKWDKHRSNVHEALYGQSRNDFISKMSIALKEASETEYWLELLQETEYIDEKQYQSMASDCTELKKMLIAIVKNTKPK